MYSVTVLHSHLPSRPSIVATQDDRILAIKSVRFAQIPSWVSLKCAPSSEKSDQIRQGQVENLHLVSLSKNGRFREVHEFLKQMEEAGVSVTTHSYKCLLEACGDLESLSDGMHIHDRLQRTVKNPPRFLQNSVLQMYCDCGCLSNAHKLFDKMLDKNLVSWILMISAYARYGLLDEAIRLFLSMQESGFSPNQSIFISLIRMCADLSLLELGKHIHSLAIRNRFHTNVSINMELLNMYVKCGRLEAAQLVFDGMAEKNTVAWTALMVGYTQADKFEDAISLFVQMVRDGTSLDEFVFSIILKACARLEDTQMGMQIHGCSIKLGLDSEATVGTPIVDFYAKCASFASACRAFEKIHNPSDVSWSSIISAYGQNGKYDEAIQFFTNLRRNDIVLNSFMYTSIFQACSALIDLNLGAQAHADAIKRGLISYLYGESALITMYSKCGTLDYAYRAFKSLDKPDIVAWTAIICANAYHGNASEVLRLFNRMQESGARANAVTFVAVLTACSHSGLVREGKQYLNSMSTVYGVEPTIDHYICMIDIYSRAGLLQDALQLIKMMPFEPDAMSWKTLLGGCWTHRNLEVGKIAVENLMRLDPEDTASYVIMFNLYASHGKWEEAGCYRKMMAERDLRKELSCSWISVKGTVHRFIVGDKHHPQTEQIYMKLRELNLCAKNGHKTAFLTEEDALSDSCEREEQLLDHSERLAIAFGVISIPSNVPILVFKNLRACKDCHDFAKEVSMVTGREIVVRDSTRFHHFKLGECSCSDYW